ncbi:DOPA 4,5-dioxygenase family protein [Microcoleus sp. B7-D4]|uniref:DOPA 4,5-dioxygenase family protein n=1 Tax=Microcoleus sp. B7-D4 TaxID=2818696 RepID=UPI002FD51427
MKEDTIEIVGFHAHIYFDADSRDAAERVREGLAQFEVQLGRWHDKPIGPHPQAMYQVAFLPSQFGKVVPWLMLHREGLDILVHPETGDDVADHTLHSLWLGEKLELNVEVLRQANRQREFLSDRSLKSSSSFVNLLLSSINSKGAWTALDHGALLRSSETLRKNAAAKNSGEKRCCQKRCQKRC